MKNNAKDQPQTMYKTFICTTNTLVEQVGMNVGSRSKLSQLHFQFEKHATHSAKANLVEIMGYQLGLHRNIDPSLKHHLTNRRRIMKQTVDSVVSTLQKQQAITASNTTTTFPTRAMVATITKQQDTSVSQLYKMRIDFILNP